MESLANGTYAVIGRDNRVMDFFEDVNDAFAFMLAMDGDAYSVELIDDSGEVLNTLCMDDVKRKMKRQKGLAALGILLSIAATIMTDGDATFAVVMIPLMIILFCSKKYWLTD